MQLDRRIYKECRGEGESQVLVRSNAVRKGNRKMKSAEIGQDAKRRTQWASRRAAFVGWISATCQSGRLIRTESSAFCRSRYSAHTWTSSGVRPSGVDSRSRSSPRTAEE